MQPTFKKRSLWTILFVAFLDNLSVGILLPLVPLLITTHTSEYSILPANYSINQGYVLFGYLMAIYTVAQFFSTPILGQLSDRYGRKPILVLSLMGTTLAYLLFGYAVITKNLPLLFISRFFDGITGGNVSVAQAAISDLADPKNKAKTYGLFGAALGIGFAFGPYIGSIFSNDNLVPWFNTATPFWVTAVVAAFSVLMLILFFQETHAPEKRRLSFGAIESFKDIGRALTQKHLRTLFSAIFFWRLGFAFFATFAAVFLIYRFGLDHQDLGTFFLYTGLWLIFGQLVTVRIIANKVIEEKLVYLSVFGAAGVMLFYLVPATWQGLMFVLPFFTNFMAISMANIPALVSKAASADRQGEYMGMNNSVQAVALTIAPILSGYISAKLTPVSIIITAATLMGVAAIIFASYSLTKKVTLKA